jgi:hypothetical protein
MAQPQAHRHQVQPRPVLAGLVAARMLKAAMAAQAKLTSRFSSRLL